MDTPTPKHDVEVPEPLESDTLLSAVQKVIFLAYIGKSSSRAKALDTATKVLETLTEYYEREAAKAGLASD